MQVIILLLLLLLLCNHYRGGSDSPAALAMAGPLLGPAFNSHTYHIMYIRLTWLLNGLHVITNEMAELSLRMHYTTVAIPDARFFGSISQSGSDSNSYG